LKKKKAKSAAEGGAPSPAVQATPQAATPEGKKGKKKRKGGPSEAEPQAKRQAGAEKQANGAEKPTKKPAPGNKSEKKAEATGPSETLQCVTCNQGFEFSAEEKAFFVGKGFEPPKRCKDCRVKAKAERKTTREGKPRVCFNCKKEGHYVSDCPDPVKCINCGDGGHGIKDCPKPKVCRAFKAGECTRGADCKFAHQ